MDAMNIFRVAISVFIVVLIGVATTGWIWTGSHQSAAQSTASRFVLSICILAGIVGLAAIWRNRTPNR
jgi:hypothetical protein